MPKLLNRVGKLENLTDLAKFQARLVKLAVGEGGEDSRRMNQIYKAGILAGLLRQTLEASDLEKRVKELENRLE